MASSTTKLSLLFALPLALACKFEMAEPGDTEAGETETAGDTDGQGTTSGGGTATTVPVTAGQTEPGDGSATDPGDPTATAGDATSTGTSVGTVGTSIGSASDTIGSASDSIGDTEDPLGPPKPCEGEATEIGPFPTQIAYLASQNQPEPPDPSGGVSSATDPGDPDPATLSIRFASQVNTCANPGAILECGKGDGWSVEIHIPQEFQSPGLYNLAGSDIIAIANEVIDDGADGCGFGGGSIEGSLEILAIDGDKVEGRLCHVQAAFGADGPDIEGTFVAPRCP